MPRHFRIEQLQAEARDMSRYSANPYTLPLVSSRVFQFQTTLEAEIFGLKH